MSSHRRTDQGQPGFAFGQWGFESLYAPGQNDSTNNNNTSTPTSTSTSANTSGYIDANDTINYLPSASTRSDAHGHIQSQYGGRAVDRRYQDRRDRQQPTSQPRNNPDPLQHNAYSNPNPHASGSVDSSTSSEGDYTTSESEVETQQQQRPQQRPQQSTTQHSREPVNILDSDDSDDSDEAPRSTYDDDDDRDIDTLFGDSPADGMPPTTRRSSNRAHDYSRSIIDLTTSSPEMDRRNLPRNQGNNNTRKRRRDSASETPPTSGQQPRNSDDANPRPRKRNHNANQHSISTTDPNSRNRSRPSEPHSSEPEAEDENPSAEAELLAAQRAETLALQQAREAKGQIPIGKRSCIICMEPFTNATATACGHIYCHECLTRALMAGEKAANEGNGNGARGQGFCPMCRKGLKRKNKGDVVVVSFMTKGRFEKERERRESRGLGGDGGRGVISGGEGSGAAGRRRGGRDPVGRNTGRG